MRLPARQLTVIRDLARKHFGESAIVYLFGSRVDDALRDGAVRIRDGRIRQWLRRLFSKVTVADHGR